MPWWGYRYKNRSAEALAERARETQKRRESWERMKAQVAARHATDGAAQ